jgi:hypothetical protein
LKWQNIDADDLPAEVKKSFDAMVEAEATFKADLDPPLDRLFFRGGTGHLCIEGLPLDREAGRYGPLGRGFC